MLSWLTRVLHPPLTRTMCTLGLYLASRHSMLVTCSEIVLSNDITLFCGFFVPTKCGFKIFGCSSSDPVTMSELALGNCQAQFGGFSEPSNRFAIILWHASAILVAETDGVLRTGKPGRLLPGRLEIPLEGFLVVLQNTVFVGITSADTILGIGTA